MSEYEPELGQAIFGQPHKAFAVPEFVTVGLLSIALELDRKTRGRSLSPFDNSGPEGDFKNDVFEVCAYSWGDEDQPFNFKWRDVEISWYKHLGRGMSANVEITLDMASNCLTECLASLREMGAAQ